jgi:hypothetical protein
MAVGDIDHLQHYLVRSIGDEAVFFNDCRVDNDALLVARAQVCPLCLREEQFMREEWELAMVTVCTRHKVRLMDMCPVCRQPIEWTRSVLRNCNNCGLDFGEAVTAAVDDSDCDFANDFSALAPFRFTLHGGGQQIHSWDTAFRVFKSLALPTRYWAESEWPARYVQSMPVDERHLTAKMLGNTRSNGSYRLMNMNEVVHALLSPLDAVPREGIIASRSMRFLHSEVGIPRDVAAAICSPTPIFGTPTGAQVFGGFPPHISGLRELASFLAVDHETVSGLIEIGMIDIPSGEHPGFDIDQVLAAQSFLTVGLLGVADIARLVGVPIDWHEHGFDELLPTWNRKHPADVRVAVEHVTNIQLQLTTRWRNALPPERPICLRTLGASSGKPFQTVALAVNMLLSGGFRHIGWGPMFDWASLQIDESQSMQMLKQLSKFQSNREV